MDTLFRGSLKLKYSLQKQIYNSKNEGHLKKLFEIYSLFFKLQLGY